MVDRKLPFPDGELDQAFELGAVDHRSVRVWIRDPHVSRATVTLTVEGREPVTETTSLSADTDWTGTIQLDLDEPAPGVAFTCEYCGQERAGRLAPTPGEPASMVFGFGSCNRPFTVDENGEVVHNPASAIYPLMQEELLRENAAFMLLGGDQIYSDELEPISVRSELIQDPENPPPMDDMIDAYRHIYRGYYGHPGFNELRQSLPTLCIWDDHDIYDNWGSTFHETPLDTAMFQAATHTYLEYQHLRNPGTKHEPPPYHYDFQYGDIGFFVLDVRGQRNYTENRLLGDEQWAELDRFLDSEEAQELKTLFVFSTIPVAHTARWMGMAFSRFEWRIAASVRDRWTSRNFLSQRDELLNRLLEWQTAKPRRQVVILSGDIHVASATTVRHRAGPGRIEQFISSAMTTPIEKIHVFLHQVVITGRNLFEPKFRFQHHFLASENNYGLIRLHPDPEGGHQIELLIRGLDTRTNTLKTVGRRVCSPTD